jgi:hypothetical protein
MPDDRAQRTVTAFSDAGSLSAWSIDRMLGAEVSSSDAPPQMTTSASCIRMVGSALFLGM